MKCPRCVQQVTPGAESCPHCGYTMAVACGFYGEWSVVAEPLMDVESRLTAEERQEIRGIFAQFTTQFPQLFFLMYLGALPPPASPRQFAFWLLNHAAVTEVDALLPNERGLLLVVDPLAGSAVLASGYFLESFVSQAELDAVLLASRKELGRADYPGALRVVAAALGKLLRKKAKEAARDPDRFRPAPEAEGFPGLVRTGEPVMTGPETPLFPDDSPQSVAPSVATEATASPEEVTDSPAARTPRKPARRLKPAARRNPPRRS